MLIDLHVSEINAAIALFSGVAEKIREQAIAQSTQPEAEAAAQAKPASDAASADEAK